MNAYSLLLLLLHLPGRDVRRHAFLYRAHHFWPRAAAKRSRRSSATVEATIWLFAIGKAVAQNLNDWTCFVAFAAGFTIGNFLGVILEGKLAIGTLVVRVITHRNGREIKVETLKAAEYGVTSLDAQARPERCRLF